MMDIRVGLFIEVLPVSFTVLCMCVWTRDQLAVSLLQMMRWAGHKTKLFNS